MPIIKKGGYTQPDKPANPIPPSQRPGGEAYSASSDAPRVPISTRLSHVYRVCVPGVRNAAFATVRPAFEYLARAQVRKRCLCDRDYDPVTCRVHERGPEYEERVVARLVRLYNRAYRRQRLATSDYPRVNAAHLHGMIESLHEHGAPIEQLLTALVAAVDKQGPDMVLGMLGSLSFPPKEG
jgi:hypothetical protein